MEQIPGNGVLSVYIFGNKTALYQINWIHSILQYGSKEAELKVGCDREFFTTSLSTRDPLGELLGLMGSNSKFHLDYGPASGNQLLRLSPGVLFSKTNFSSCWTGL